MYIVHVLIHIHRIHSFVCLFVSHKSRVFVKLFETRERQKLIAVSMKGNNQINNNQQHKSIRLAMMISKKEVTDSICCWSSRATYVHVC